MFPEFPNNARPLFLSSFLFRVGNLVLYVAFGGDIEVVFG